MVDPPGQLSSCRLLAKSEVGGMVLGDAGDDVSGRRKGSVKGLKITAQESASRAMPAC